MGKGRKRKPTRTKPATMKVVAAPAISPAEQAVATKRMADLFKAVSAPPEGFVPMLDRLAVPYQIGRTPILPVPFGDEDGIEFLIIKMSDLIDGEERNQAQGSVLSRLANKRIDERVELLLAKRENGE